MSLVRRNIQFFYDLRLVKSTNGIPNYVFLRPYDNLTIKYPLYILNLVHNVIIFLIYLIDYLFLLYIINLSLSFIYFFYQFLKNNDNLYIYPYIFYIVF
jgi:hypothetical protein